MLKRDECINTVLTRKTADGLSNGMVYRPFEIVVLEVNAVLREKEGIVSFNGSAVLGAKALLM